MVHELIEPRCEAFHVPLHVTLADPQFSQETLLFLKAIEPDAVIPDKSGLHANLIDETTSQKDIGYEFDPGFNVHLRHCKKRPLVCASI